MKHDRYKCIMSYTDVRRICRCTYLKVQNMSIKSAVNCVGGTLTWVAETRECKATNVCIESS